MILDVQLVSDCGSPRGVALALKEQKKLASLSATLHVAESRPADSTVGDVVMDKGNGQLDVIKYVTFKNTMATRAVKKAFQSLLCRLPGHHVH